jgi:hypothetical protein
MRRGLRLAVSALWTVVCGACGACGGSGSRGPARDLPAYTGHAVELFDDVIEPVSVGYAVLPSAAPATDARLRERVQTGDAVVRARVVTVTSKREGEGHAYQLAFHTLERLAGKGPLDTDFTLDIASSDQAAGIIKAFDAGLVGNKFVVFVRAFAHPGDAYEADLRFHLAGETPAELDAVKQAMLLQQVRQ